jgi:predicted RNA-binding protein with PIN domain
LGLLVDTLADAAAGIRRELSLAPSTVRPGDTVVSVDGAPPSRRADDPIAVERLLALPNVHVIVDGYNVTKTGYGELPLADQRARLVASMSAVVARSRAEVTVAFDGGAKPPAQPPTPRGVRVLFSAADEIADDLIRRLVAAEPQGRPVVVVTSDQQVVTDVLAAGAWAVPSAVFLARIG